MSEARKLKNRVNNKVESFYYFIRENLKYYIFKDFVILDGYPHSKNFGDALSVYVVKKLSNKTIIYGQFLINKKVDSFACIGSMLQWCTKSSTIWGAGFIKPISNCESQFTNEKIYAVRGYKTLEILKRNNYNISNIKIGDPALLLPLLHLKKYSKGKKIGILPHYVDKNMPWIDKMCKENSNVTLIDIEQGQNIDGFLTQLNECEIVLSSSLHGLILADTYGIKNLWIRFSENIEGGNFKFNDYYSSIGVEDQEPIHITTSTVINDLVKKAKTNSISLNLEDLLISFPIK